jgi:hypothetical protein
MSGAEQQEGARFAEHARLAEGSAAPESDWKLFGRYLAPLGWGAVREGLQRRWRCLAVLSLR